MPGVSAMQTTRPKSHLVEWGVLLGVAVLIAAEAAAVIGGIGPIFTVVALGYLLVLGVAYWLYRRAATSRSVHLESSIVEAHADGSYRGVRALRDVDIFQDLSDSQIESVAALGQPLEISAGQVLERTGEPGLFLFIIIKGKAQLSAHSAIGEITVRIAGPGESFPLAALIGEGTLITSAEAMTEMTLLAIPRSQLLRLCSEQPEIGMRLYSAIAAVLGNRYRRTLEHLTTSAERALKDVGFFADV